MAHTARSSTKADFAYAQAHEERLTETQRQVLDLLVRGKTNGQVGEALGITLDGAKWHVSEVLTKLGFATRDEAAAYWRWRNAPRQRLARMASAALGVPVLKLAAGGAGVVATVAVAAMVVAAGAATDTAANGLFYLEAEITVSGAEDSSDAAAPRANPTSLKWWMRDETHARFEFVDSMVGVADGKDLWYYDPVGNTYSRTALSSDAQQAVLEFNPATMLVGPAPGESLAELVDHLRADHRQAAPVGTDTILGRNVTVVEVKPATHSMSTTTGEDGSSATRAVGRGIMRLWLDEGRMFVMRSEVDSGDQDVVAEVTHLDYPADISDEVVAFEPRPGAQPLGAAAQTGQGFESCADAAAIDEPQDGGPARHTIGPVWLVMPVGYSATPGAVEVGATLPVLLRFDPAHVSDRAGVEFTVRAAPSPPGPTLRFLEPGHVAAMAVPSLELTVESPAENLPAQSAFDLFTPDSGCHYFEIVMDGTAYGPFGVDVAAP